MVHPRGSGERDGVSTPHKHGLGWASIARSVAVIAVLVMAGGASVIVLTLLRERPIPDVNTLLIPTILLAVACSAWIGLVLRVADRPLRRGAGTWITRFTHPSEWSGLTRRARLALGVVGLVSLIIAASANPSLGGYKNDPSIPTCSPGASRALTCVSYALHQHALAARQRFIGALVVGFFTFVLGIALSNLRAEPAAVLLPNR